MTAYVPRRASVSSAGIPPITRRRTHTKPRAWVQQWFSAKAARQGGVIRRRIDYVEQYTSLEEVEREARRRGWHVVMVGGQVVVLCNTGELTVVC